MEIWTIKLECVFGWYLEEPTLKLCEIQNTYSLVELCDFILDSFEFDNDHLHQFFVSRSTHNRKNVVSNELTELKDIFPMEKNQTLFMNFDFGDDWVFKISRSRKRVQLDPTASYPRVVECVGKNPEQYPMCEAWE